ncbi:uncharacterized protein VICG_00650 [Vittaforma corneae ATCC 50505]|uniref:60S ribosomal protein L10P insertion domain-containing protein n=1 Tax=Vittaforma corneae (strain ATCC 50505) TaxID=993615 RepID=L2GN46_VITCO|nr:uncharacterized protein VICG_00650 [Vittaforma corneae ATCC 50505]ELA42251.1 hypothetical protein VICG_00650 [Vittaforma corneae ATCC 50505]
MAELSKKSKEEKIEGVRKIQAYLSKYSTVVVVENTDIKTQCIQRLRSLLRGKVIFAKKSLLQKNYPQLSFEKSFFLIFIDGSELEKVISFKCNTFIKAGEVSPVDFVISAGIVKNPKLASILMPIEKRGSMFHLLEDYKVLSEGQPADEKATEILKAKDIRPMERNLTILGQFESKELAKNEQDHKIN